MSLGKQGTRLPLNYKTSVVPATSTKMGVPVRGGPFIISHAARAEEGVLHLYLGLTACLGSAEKAEELGKSRYSLHFLETSLLDTGKLWDLVGPVGPTWSGGWAHPHQVHP